MVPDSIAIKLKKLLQKYQYALLILVIGLILMIIPTKSEKKSTPPRIEPIDPAYSLQEQLEDMLYSMEGAGRVKVMLTVAEGQRIIYQKDREESRSESGTQHRNTTVILPHSGQSEQGLVEQKIPEKYQGAIVLCEGAGKPEICLKITEAVSKATGLSSDRICILKMN